MKKGGEEASIVTHRPPILARVGHWRLSVNWPCERRALFFRFSSLRHRGLHDGRDHFGRQRIAQGLSRYHYPIIQY
jgi:hypothetical protein